jgi:hypothetical protein
MVRCSLLPISSHPNPSQPTNTSLPSPHTACLFLGYCTGNIAGPFFYLSSQAPRYELGIWSMIVSHLIEAALILTLRFILSRENKRRDALQGAMEGGLEGRDLDATAFGDLTDGENLNFRYIY